jgi:3-hydroxybutyryl-CoA dehydrogenase
MVQTIGVCGAGTMGSGIAQVAAMAGYPTILYDVDAGMVEQRAAPASKKASRSLKEKKKITATEQQAALGRLSFVHDVERLHRRSYHRSHCRKARCQAGPFPALAAVNDPKTILASNTSSLSLDALAEKIPGPERFAGMHFFNPAPLMKLVEVVYTQIYSRRDDPNHYAGSPANG